MALADDPDIDVVVELIGGSGGSPASCAKALSQGKHVVTANKALLALHGTALARAAETSGRTLAFEAAVAGGIPIIKALREGLAANRIGRLYGILNGTCNYILTKMRNEGREFVDVLKEAQALGYAEVDPSFDVDGVDTGHKLAILAATAFGGEVDFPAVSLEGIRHVSARYPLARSWAIASSCWASPGAPKWASSNGFIPAWCCWPPIARRRRLQRGG